VGCSTGCCCCCWDIYGSGGDNDSDNDNDSLYEEEQSFLSELMTSYWLKE